MHLDDFVAERFVQDFVGALTGAVAGVDFLHVQVAEAFGECFDAVVGCAEEMESAEDGVDLLAGEGGFDFLDDVVGAAVTAAVHDEQSLWRIEDEALFVVKTVVAVLAVFFDAHVSAFADFVEVWSLVADERDSRENFNIAVDEFNAVGVSLESAFADADVFLIREKLENFIAVVAVLGCGLSQVKFGVVVLVEEFLHAVCVIVMRVAQNAGINCGKVDAHAGGILGEECGSSCVEQDALAVEFGVDAKSPFTVQLLW